MSYGFTLTFILILLKIANVVSIGWWWVFSPVPIIFAFILIGKLINVISDIINEKDM